MKKGKKCRPNKGEKETKIRMRESTRNEIKEFVKECTELIPIIISTIVTWELVKWLF